MTTISLRLPDSIHRKIKELAAKDGTSVNQFLASAAAEKVSALETESYLAERARRGQRARFLELLAKAPAAEPEAFDQLPEEDRRLPVADAPAVREATKAPRTQSPRRRGRR